MIKKHIENSGNDKRNCVTGAFLIFTRTFFQKTERFFRCPKPCNYLFALCVNYVFFFYGRALSNNKLLVHYPLQKVRSNIASQFFCNTHWQNLQRLSIEPPLLRVRFSTVAPFVCTCQKTFNIKFLKYCTSMG